MSAASPRVRRAATAVIGGLALALALASPASAAPPPNDEFPGETLASPLPATATGTNVDATKAPTDPAVIDTNGGGSSVWWSWTAPEDAEVIAETCGSDFDTLLGVYSGDTPPVTLIAHDDDTCGTRSQVKFDAVEGTTYRILVDGFNAAEGAITLHLDVAPPPPPPPPNDNFPGIDLGDALPTSDTGTNVSATKQANEPATIADNGGGASVWWSWTSPVTARIRVSTCSSGFNTLLGVYTGDTLPVTPVTEGNDECGLGSLVEFEATTGTAYRIAVDGFDPPGAPAVAEGNVALQIEPAPIPPPPPPNDDLEDAEEIVNNPDPVDGFTFEGNRFATKEANENNHAGNFGGHSIWYSWTAHETGEFVARTCGSELNSLLGVYTDPDLPGPFPLSEVGSNDDNQAICGGGSNDAAVSFNATAGDVFKFAVDGKNGATTAGLMLLQVYSIDDLPPPPPAPPNDNFSGTDLGNALPASANGTNVGGSKQEDEPELVGSNAGGSSVWWSWTSPVTDTIRVQTCNSNFDTLLGVYVGDALPVDLVASADGGCVAGEGSVVDIDAVTGTTYRIVVDGFDLPGEPEAPAQGDIGLSIALAPEPPPPPTPPGNDNFAAAESLSGASDTATGDNRNATIEAEEPNHYPAAGSFPRKSIWYSWTAPASGTATISLCGSSANFDSVLAVYEGASLGSLSTVENDDDACTAPSAAGPSRVSFPAVADKSYRIAIDSYVDRESGAIALELDLDAEKQGANDTTDPETSIDVGPKKKTTKRKARFRFSSNEDGVEFECARKNRPYRSCTSPYDVRAKRGRNKFYVRAIDRAGNVDDTPAAFAWRYRPPK